MWCSRTNLGLGPRPWHSLVTFCSFRHSALAGGRNSPISIAAELGPAFACRNTAQPPRGALCTHVPESEGEGEGIGASGTGIAGGDVDVTFMTDSTPPQPPQPEAATLGVVAVQTEGVGDDAAQPAESAGGLGGKPVGPVWRTRAKGEMDGRGGWRGREGVGASGSRGRAKAVAGEGRREARRCHVIHFRSARIEGATATRRTLLAAHLPSPDSPSSSLTGATGAPLFSPLRVMLLPGGAPPDAPTPPTRPAALRAVAGTPATSLHASVQGPLVPLVDAPVTPSQQDSVVGTAVLAPLPARLLHTPRAAAAPSRVRAGRL